MRVARMAEKRSTLTAPMAFRLLWHPAASAVRADQGRVAADSAVVAEAVAADLVAVVAVADRSKLNQYLNYGVALYAQPFFGLSNKEADELADGIECLWWLGLSGAARGLPHSVVLPQVPGLHAGALRFGIGASRFLTGDSSRSSAIKKKICRLVPSLVLGVTMVGLPYALTVWAAGQVSPGVVATLFAFMPLAAAAVEQGGGEQSNPDP